MRRSGTAIVAAVLLVGGAIPASARIDGRASEVTSFMVRYTLGTTPEELARALASLGAETTGEIQPLRLLRVELDTDMAAALRATPGVAWARGPTIAQVTGRVPNDPLLAKQWPLRKIGALRGWGYEDGKTSPVTVAVVDTGVDPSHPDLQGALLKGVDLVNFDDDPSDDFGHGTHVAGIIAARPDNRKGIAGLSWGADIMPLKACGFDGSCNEFLVAAAIVYAVQQGAKVVNLSLGGAGDVCPPGYDLARRYAEQRGVVLIASAGNSGSKKAGNPMMYPAGCEGYIGVGATTPFDGWAPFSEHNSSVDLSAPGMGVVSTLPPSLSMEDDASSPGYGPADGTSMAAPYVAGLAALLLSAHPEWTPAQVEQRMSETAIDLGRRGRDDYFGEGRIDVARALSGATS